MRQLISFEHIFLVLACEIVVAKLQTATFDISVPQQLVLASKVCSTRTVGYGRKLITLYRNFVMERDK